MSAVICLTIIFLIGYAVQRVLVRGFSTLSAVGISFGIGASLICIQMLLYNFLHVGWSFASVLLPWFIILIPFFFSQKKLLSKPDFKRQSPIAYFLFSLIAILVLFALLETLARPVTAWDAVASWYLGGKAFFLEGSILPSYYIYVNYDYPPFMHFLLAAVNFLNTKFDDTFSQLLYFSFYPFIVLLLYSMLRVYLTRNFSLLLTFLFASTQNVLRHSGKYDIGNADLPLAYFMLVTLFLILKYYERKSFGVLFLALTTLASTALVKNDGVPFFIVGFLILFYLWLKHGSKNLSFYLFPIALLPLIYWKIFSSFNALPPSYINFMDFHLERFYPIVFGILGEMLNIQRWNFVWIFILLALTTSKRLIKYPILTSVLIIQFLSYIYVYFVTPIEVSSHIANSFDRLLIQILPMAFLLASISAFHKQKNKLQ